MAVIRDVMPAFELFQPASTADALNLLDRYGADAWILAGGLDSFDWLKDRIKRPRYVVDLGGIAELKGIRERDGGLEIGAMTTLTEVVRHPMVRERYAILTEAAEAAASPQIRNQGTIGGNVSQDTRCWYYRAGWSCYRAGGNICYADTPDCDQSRARDPGRRPLRGRQSVRHRARADRAGASMVIRGAERRARRRRRGLLHRARHRHHADDRAAAGRAADGDSHARRLGRIARSISRRCAIGRCGTSRWSASRPRWSLSGTTIQNMRLGRQRRRRAAAASGRVEQFVEGQAAQRGDRGRRRRDGDRRRAAAAVQRLQSAVDAEPGEASDPRGGGMDYFLTWGHSPWGQQILTHVSWNLLWASLFAGVAFLVAHASYMVLSAHRKRHPDETDAMEACAPDLPPRITRHSLAPRARSTG